MGYLDTFYHGKNKERCENEVDLSAGTTVMNGQTLRNTKLDMLRGIAILLVIFGHGIELLLQKGFIARDVGEKIYDAIYMFHMPLFFMISGYVSKSNKERVKSIIIKNIITYYVPYLILSYAYWIARLVAWKLFGIQLLQGVPETSLMEIVQRCWNTKDLAWAWFLLSLLLVKIVFNLLDTYASERVAFACFSIIFWLAYIFPQNQAFNYLSWGIYFTIGYLVHKYHVNENQRLLMFIMCINVMAIGIVRYLDCGLDMVVKLLVGVAVFMIYMLFVQCVPDLKFIIFCGRESMVLYMVHGLVQYRVYHILAQIFHIQTSALLLSLLLIVQLLLAFMIIKVSAKIRWIQFIFYPYRYIQQRNNK
ncbi:MAG: acyltransferase family protein [Lachnospiraceae bacterium]|nr:acyltransferase family protein [Lachnospiraceae bacterium]